MTSFSITEDGDWPQVCVDFDTDGRPMVQIPESGMHILVQVDISLEQRQKPEGRGLVMALANIYLLAEI